MGFYFIESTTLASDCRAQRPGIAQPKASPSIGSLQLRGWKISRRDCQQVVPRVKNVKANRSLSQQETTSHLHHS